MAAHLGRVGDPADSRDHPGHKAIADGLMAAAAEGLPQVENRNAATIRTDDLRAVEDREIMAACPMVVDPSMKAMKPEDAVVLRVIAIADALREITRGDTKVVDGLTTATVLAARAIRMSNRKQIPRSATRSRQPSPRMTQ